MRPRLLIITSNKCFFFFLETSPLNYAQVSIDNTLLTCHNYWRRCHAAYRFCFLFMQQKQVLISMSLERNWSLLNHFSDKHNIHEESKITHARIHTSTRAGTHRHMRVRGHTHRNTHTCMFVFL